MKYMQTPSGEVFTTECPEYHKDCKTLTATAGKVARQQYAREKLRSMLKPGQTVYCVLRSKSASGMSRRISLLIVDGDCELRNIDNLTADATGFKHSDKGGLIVAGCGMDMGFHLVYSLGYALWPDGTPEPHGRRNGEPDLRAYPPHGRRNGEPDLSGGYALKSNWV